jgi:similar to spore coat protein
MNSIIENLTGLNTLTDQVIAMDLLMSAKSGIKMYAVAATESATPEVRATFEKHLFEAIETHDTVTAYVMQKGFYHPYNVQEQLQLDRSNVQTALNIPS